MQNRLSIIIILLFPLTAKAQSDTIPLINSGLTIEKGIKLRGEESYENAVKELQKVPESDTNYVWAQSELLVTHNLAKDYKKAQKIGVQLVAHPSKYTQFIYVEWGNSWLHGGEPEQAAKVYEAGLKKYPYSHLLHNNYGVALFRLERYAEATHHFKECLSINPYNANSHLMLANLMILQGNRAKAMLSLETYLILKPTDNGALVKLENLVKNADRLEGTITTIEDNGAFYDLELLLRSAAALDKRFRPSVDFNASLVRYTELLIEKLPYQTPSDDFWMKMYVPFFIQLKQLSLTETFIYQILASTENAAVLKWTAAHQKEGEKLTQLAAASLAKIRQKRTATILGQHGEYPAWYFDSGALNAMGYEDSNEVRKGPWAIYWANGELGILGKYDEQGRQVGQWQYFFENGVLRKNEIYDQNGLIIENADIFYEDGTPSAKLPYSNGKINGEALYYYPCGQLREVNSFANGVVHGPGAVHFKTGQKYSSFNFLDDELHGEYKYFFKNGQVKNSYSYLNGEITGDYVGFFAEGKKFEKGQYIDDKATGIWTGYHRNGNPQFEGTYSNDNRVGVWKFYNQNGRLEQQSNYDEFGLLHGESTAFDKDGMVYKTFTYRHDTLIGYSNYGFDGKLLSQGISDAGNFDWNDYTPARTLNSSGSYLNGKLNGALKYYYPNGQVKEEGSALDHNWEGAYTSYYESGEVETKLTYENKQINGLFQEFHKNGKLKLAGWQVNDLFEQTWEEYLASGILYKRSYFINGELHGQNDEFGPEGRLHTSFIYDRGILLSVMQYDTLGVQFHSFEIEGGTGPVEFKYPNGKPSYSAYYTCGEPSGDVLEYHINGRLKSKTLLVNAESNGRYEAYNEQGLLILEGEYLNNQQTGTWKWYNDDGSVYSTTEYQNGEIHGKNSYFFPNGQLNQVCDYSNGEKEGSCRYYTWDGVLQMEKLFSEGVLTGYRYETERGKLSEVIPFESTPEFVLTAYFPNKQVSVIQNFKNGLLDGESKYFNQEGKLLDHGIFKGGDFAGAYREYYSDGSIWKDQNFAFDERNGRQMEYYNNGKLKSVTNYKMGIKDGYEVKYKPDGTVISKFYFWNGVHYEN